MLLVFPVPQEWQVLLDPLVLRDLLVCPVRLVQRARLAEQVLQVGPDRLAQLDQAEMSANQGAPVCKATLVLPVYLDFLVHSVQQDRKAHQVMWEIQDLRAQLVSLELLVALELQVCRVLLEFLVSGVHKDPQDQEEL